MHATGKLKLSPEQVHYDNSYYYYSGSVYDKRNCSHYYYSKLLLG